MKQIPAILLLFILSASSAAGAAEDPVFFPDGQTVSGAAPFFFWQDLSPDDQTKTLFRISISGGKDVSPLFEAFPRSYKGFLYLCAPRPLAPGNYSYELFPLYNGKPDLAKYFGYRRYPIQGSFSAADSAAADPLAAIDYLSASEANISGNGINTFFFAGGAAACGGISALFFTALDFNIWTKIAACAFAAGAATGTSAAGYYGFQYISTKRQLDAQYRMIRERGIRLSFSSGL
jgi:hypothetical protein